MDNNVKIITSEMLKTVFPYNSSVNLDTFDEAQTICYLQMYTVYRELLYKYLIELLNLDIYDKAIRNSNLGFNKVNYEKMDVYQSFDINKLDYFYLRNNLYLERLSKDQYQFLINKVKSSDRFTLDQESINFIKNTFPKVIFEDRLKNGQRCKINFGPETPEFLVPNDSIVIGFRYDVYNQNSLNNDEWDKRFILQQNYIQDLIKKMKDEFFKKGIVNVYVIIYDEFSTKKKQVINYNK